jgi:hypothetical protein
MATEGKKHQLGEKEENNVGWNDDADETPSRCTLKKKVGKEININRPPRRARLRKPFQSSQPSSYTSDIPRAERRPMKTKEIAWCGYGRRTIRFWRDVKIMPNKLHYSPVRKFLWWKNMFKTGKAIPDE